MDFVIHICVYIYIYINGIYIREYFFQCGRSFLIHRPRTDEEFIVIIIVMKEIRCQSKLKMTKNWLSVYCNPLPTITPNLGK